MTASDRGVEQALSLCLDRQPYRSAEALACGVAVGANKWLRLKSFCSRLTPVLALLALFGTKGFADVPAPSPPLGRWLSQDHDGVFEIKECGQSLCGRLIAMRYTGSMPTDNQGHPQCGLMMLTGFVREPSHPDTWSGMILDPEKGRRYHAQIWSPEPGLLKLRGYLLIPLFGQTQRWTRYDGAIGTACHLPG